MFCRFGLAAGHPSGLGPDLVVVGMDAPGRGMNRGEIAIAVRGDALGRLFVRKEQPDDRMRIGDLPQRPLLGIRDLDAQVCQGSDELARGVEIDAGQLLGDLSRQAFLLRTRAIPQRGPCCDVDGHARLLEPDQGRDGGELEGGNLLESFVRAAALAERHAVARVRQHPRPRRPRGRG